MRVRIITTITQEFDTKPEHWGLPANASVAAVLRAINEAYNDTGEAVEQILPDEDAEWDVAVSEGEVR
jgi:hypothetical protein